MKIVRVSGENNKHRVFMYALSTCAWCKMTKKFLNDNKIEYDYVDVDVSNEEDRKAVQRDIQGRGGSLTYPTIIIDDKTLINGFRQDRLKEALEI